MLKFSKYHTFALIKQIVQYTLNTHIEIVNFYVQSGKSSPFHKNLHGRRPPRPRQLSGMAVHGCTWIQVELSTATFLKGSANWHPQGGANVNVYYRTPGGPIVQVGVLM